jgi:hypothetical protein
VAVSSHKDGTLPSADYRTDRSRSEGEGGGWAGSDKQITDDSAVHSGSRGR